MNVEHHARWSPAGPPRPTFGAGGVGGVIEIEAKPVLLCDCGWFVADVPPHEAAEGYQRHIAEAYQQWLES